MERLMIVSNRLPVTIKHEKGQIQLASSAGGLATALKGPHQNGDSLWIGWPGDVSKIEADKRIELEKKFEGMRVSPVNLSATDVHHFYEGFSNGVLWPLYHYLTDKVEREAWTNWKTYAEVNRKFAKAIIEKYREGDLIWVHDYQLSLVPKLIREEVPGAKIGFFLHIPFPSSEVFRILPWRREILEGMMGSDLIGFHTYSYVRHFTRSLIQIMNLEAEDGKVVFNGRRVHLNVFPIGIDVNHFETLANDPEVKAEAEKIRTDNQNKKIILGIDRLDYTKGLPRRLMAVERLLEREPELRDKIKYVQVVVPSRTKVESYAKLRREMDEMVGRINASHGSVATVPIHYLYRSVSEKILVALYQSADVMLVTPLRDGMNLVAKEFVCTRIQDDGVLILSEFAGAAAELIEALILNPYDIDSFAIQIKNALFMNKHEQRSRMQGLRSRVRAFDANLWAVSFIDCLKAIKADEYIHKDKTKVEGLVKGIATSSEITLVLDYDGTLVPFADTPELAYPDAGLIELLEQLGKNPRVNLHIVSGRTKETLDNWLGMLPIGLHAEHGFWSKPSGKDPWQPLLFDDSTWKKKIKPILERVTWEAPGSLVEDKSAGIAWHYRRVEPELGTQQARILTQRLQGVIVGMPLEILEGEKVIEVRRKGIHKGIVLARMFLKEAIEGAAIVAIGDDRTDEDMFQSLPPQGISIHIGGGETNAKHRLADVHECRQFLRELTREVSRRA